MENRTPASVRVPAEAHRRDARRTWLAAGAALLVHGGVLAALTLGAALHPEPPKISVDESIPVELVLDVPSAGPRTPSQAADLPLTETKPAEAGTAEAPAETPPPIAAAEAPPPPEAPASQPETASAAAVAQAPVVQPNRKADLSSTPANIGAAGRPGTRPRSRAATGSDR